MEKQLIPFIATHPGVVIKDELMARRITQKRLAEMIGMQPSMLNEIIRGKRPISAAIALSLEQALDVPAEFWIKFQYQYELDIIRQKEHTILRLQQIEEKKIIEIEVVESPCPTVLSLSPW